MKNIVLFGPPGSGKGTQASNIISKYNLIHLSTGDMLRAEIAAHSKLGLEAKSLMDKGELVPDTVVIGMIENKLNDNPKAAGFVFDGFPRTVNQAVALDKLLEKNNSPIQKVLSLKVSEDELTKRILDRGKTSGRADDQNEEIVKNRVVEYRTKTEPLANYYDKQGKLVEIQGEGTIDHISDLLYYEIDNIADKNSIVKEVATFINHTVETLFSKKDKEEVWPESPEVTGEKDVNYAPVTKKAAVKTAPKQVSAPIKKVNTPVKKAPATAKKIVAKKASPPAKKTAAPAKKTAPKKVAAPAKKAAAKKVATPIKKVAPKKAAKKAAAKKAIKKAPAKKVIAKKAAPKKVAAKKVIKKTAPKKAVKKAIPQKIVAKKAAAKKPVKKAIAKKIVKKAAPKKTIKKAAPKKAVKKPVAEKSIKKVAAKKAIAPKVAKKVAAKKAVNKAAPKKAAKKVVSKKKR
jgi:adenylate kinase